MATIQTMDNGEFLAALDRLGFKGDARKNDRGLTAFALWYGCSLATAKNYASGASDIPGGVAGTLRLMMKHGETPESVAALAPQFVTE